jgi:hypothetical protein
MMSCLGCQNSSGFSAAHVEALRNLAKVTPELSVKHYLEESVRCFEVGAYNGAVVSAWCAVARYLRLVLEKMGFDLVQVYVDKKEDLKSLDGQPLYSLCDRMLDIEKSFEEASRLGERLHGFWLRRCDCAHPTDIFLEATKAFNLIHDSSWLVTRKAEKAYLRYTVVIECVDNKQFSLNPNRMRDLVNYVAESDHESLATVLLRKFLSSNEEFASEESDVAIDDRILVAWEAVGGKLGEASRRRLMEKLADGLEVSKRQIDVVQLSRLVFWPEVDPSSCIWQYFDDWLEDDSITRGVVTRLRQYAPLGYRQRAEAWPNL